MNVYTLDIKAMLACTLIGRVCVRSKSIGAADLVETDVCSYNFDGRGAGLPLEGR